MTRKTIQLTELQAVRPQAQVIRSALIEAESLGFDSQRFDEVVDKAIAKKKRQNAAR